MKGKESIKHKLIKIEMRKEGGGRFQGQARNIPAAVSFLSLHPE